MSDDLSRWLNQLDSPDVCQRRMAAESMARLGPAVGKGAVRLVRATADEDETVREWAVAALEEMGPPNQSDVLELSHLLMASAADAALWSATLLGRLGPKGADAVPLLVQALSSHPHISVSQRAAWALGMMGAAARAAEPALEAATSSSDPRLSRLASQSLQQLGAVPQDP